MHSQKIIQTINDCSEEKSSKDDSLHTTVDKCRVSHVTITRRSHDTCFPPSKPSQPKYHSLWERKEKSALSKLPTTFRWFQFAHFWIMPTKLELLVYKSFLVCVSNKWQCTCIIHIQPVCLFLYCVMYYIRHSRHGSTTTKSLFPDFLYLVPIIQTPPTSARMLGTTL